MEDPGAWTVTADAAESDRLRTAGRAVVLVVPPGSAAPGGASPGGEAGGRLALLIGDPAEELTWEAARELAAELAAGDAAALRREAGSGDPLA